MSNNDDHESIVNVAVTMLDTRVVPGYIMDPFNPENALKVSNIVPRRPLPPPAAPATHCRLPKSTKKRKKRSCLAQKNSAARLFLQFFHCRLIPTPSSRS